MPRGRLEAGIVLAMVGTSGSKSAFPEAVTASAFTLPPHLLGGVGILSNTYPHGGHDIEDRLTATLVWNVSNLDAGFGREKLAAPDGWRYRRQKTHRYACPALFSGTRSAPLHCSP